MIKRIFDILFSLGGLLFFSPILIFFLILVWRYDKKSPLYISPRVGKNSKIFNLIKIRTMMVDADKKGISSTSNNDSRIIPIGQKIRKYKIDELTQLFNVLIGNMSLVGPRPNVLVDVNLYTNIENQFSIYSKLRTLKMDRSSIPEIFFDFSSCIKQLMHIRSVLEDTSTS